MRIATSLLATLSLIVAFSSACRTPQPDASLASVGPSAKPKVYDFQKPAAARVVAIGDVHGDFEALQKALRLAKATDERDAWIGGDLVIVQVGDQLDRGPGERQILDLLARLAIEAEAKGGSVHVLLGNHEIMNSQLDFRYVTPEGLRAFDDVRPQAVLKSKPSPNHQGRAAALAPGGGIAMALASHPVVVQIGNTVYVHGGILPAHIEYGLERINREAKDWLLGKLEPFPALLGHADGPLWTRAYGATPVDAQVCKQLRQVLAHLGARRMVVGHTPQERGISLACEGDVVRIDVGMSKAYGGPVEVLELRHDVMDILQ